MSKQEVYTDLEITISPLEEIKQLVETISNDKELGEAIRNYITTYHLKNQ